MAQRRIDAVTRIALSAILYATACSCAPMNRVPMIERPDTREIAGVVVDSVALVGSLDVFNKALPNEAAVCYTGELRDTLAVDSSHIWILHLTSVKSAVQDSASDMHVWFHNHGPIEPCLHPIAVGHSHPNANYVCDQSDDDSRLLFAESRVLVSLAWCMNGEVEVLYQDGRRNLSRWRS